MLAIGAGAQETHDSLCDIRIDMQKEPLEIGDRIKIPAGFQVKAGELNEVPLYLSGPEIPCLSVEEVTTSGAPIDNTYEEKHILHHADGAPYLQFTPTILGLVNVRVTGFYPDGGIAHPVFTLDSVPSDRKPAALLLGIGDTDLLRMPLKEVGMVYPTAYYLDSKYPVLLNSDPDVLHFSVRQTNDSPVIALDEHHRVHPLRTGDALVLITLAI